MHNSTRDAILARLQGADLKGAAPLGNIEIKEPEHWSREEKIRLLQTKMEAMRTEVHLVKAENWVHDLQAIAQKKGWKEIVYGPESPVGSDLKAMWKIDSGGIPALIPYADRIESFKKRLFDFDAGITSCIGAVADTGAVILWPTPAEPRTLSLVPSVHIAVVDVDGIYASLDEVMQAQGWRNRMPTNALLISGPSKTADIEFTLVFGVHGPKEMLLLIRT